METDQPSLARVVLFLCFGKGSGLDDVLALSENRRYHFAPNDVTDEARWRGGQERRHTEGAVLQLTFGEYMYSPEGWVLGSDTDTDNCDLQISENNETGISRQHVRVDTDPRSRLPRVRVLSRHGAVCTKDESGEAVRFLCGQDFTIDRPMLLDLGAVQFRAWSPKLTAGEESIYQGLALKWSEEAVAAAPRPLRAPAEPQDNEGGGHETMTSNVRPGRNGAVYVNQGVILSHSTTAEMIAVQERASGILYGAKVPYSNTDDDYGMIRGCLESLTKEFECLSKLDHPHIVTAVDLVLDADDKQPPWLIMEHIPHRLDTVAVNGDDGVIVLTQICSALEYLHANLVMHRNPNPDNVLMKEVACEGGTRRMAKLFGIGTARHYRDGDHTSFSVAKSAYMAPELVDQRRRYSNAADMYSLGRIALEMFSPRRASFRASGSDLPPTTEQYDDWKVPVQVRPILDGLLQRQPENRLTARACLFQLWRLTQQPISNARVGAGMTAGQEVHGAFGRSQAPTMSTTRARWEVDGERSELPDTEPYSLSCSMPPSPSGRHTPCLEDVEAHKGPVESAAMLAMRAQLAARSQRIARSHRHAVSTPSFERNQDKFPLCKPSRVMAGRKRTSVAVAADAEPVPKRRSSRRAAAAASASLNEASKAELKTTKAGSKERVAAKPKGSRPEPKSPGPKKETNNGARATSPDVDPASIPVTNADAPRHDGPWYWLMKAEPETRLENGIDVRFSIDDLRAKTKPEGWDGIRAYAARNHMRNMNAGDMAFFYHSNCKEPGIAGTMEIVREFSEDKSARRPGTPYYDAGSTKDKVRWSLVHVEFRKKFAVPIPLKELRELGKPGGPLEEMQMLRQSRLSVSRVSGPEWEALCRIADDKAKEAGRDHEVGK
ncbi:thymocyte nuclear protein 1 [Drechmeria coniospora]|uniref:Thymocyte nuclear protein 1 n=1 Tax=Drechmeria coniospora TaxID=98403 RepID=A0A151GJM7_DRECN|nr:thymocyte nuclear protein 1 [Drechmeria coniospora]KYK57288.1 thymocyte nuclear protein 1 [Drechmeria coniospora]